MKINSEVRRKIEDTTKACKICAEHASRPRRFKVTVRSDELLSNHITAVDVVYIRNRPVTHVVGEAIHFAAAEYLQSMSPKDTWKAFLKRWSRAYLGPSEFLRVNQGSNFVSRKFLDSADAEDIVSFQAPIESPSTMSHVELYHGPFRTAYLKIRAEMPRAETDADSLQMAVKALNDSIGPEGLCPTLLVYGTNTRPAQRCSTESKPQRARAMKIAMDAVPTEQAKRKFFFGLRHFSGPKGKESRLCLTELPAVAQVYVYRERLKSSDGVP